MFHDEPEDIAPLEPPTTKLGPYFYQHAIPLAQGRHATVYEAGTSVHDFNLAIKRIDMRGGWMVEQFAFKEVEVLKDLGRHPHIIKYVDHLLQHPNFMYIVTELCQKENLHDRIRKCQRLSEEEALEWAGQLVAGYQHIRSKGYIHRDLKPENLLIDWRNKLKIADFGYSTKLEDNFLEGRYNMGTPLYMAPEVLYHNRYSEKGDIWSIGVILYEMLHGVEPFKAKTEAQLMVMVKQPIKVMKCSTATALIIQQCLQCDPALRPSLNFLKKSIAEALRERGKEQEEFKEAEKKAEVESVVENELNYMQFLDYLLKLSEKAFKSMDNKADNATTQHLLDFLLQHTIRVRMSIVKAEVEDSKVELGKGQQEKLLKLAESYSEAPRDSFYNNMPMFRSRGEKYHQEEHWRCQGVFKEILQHLWARLYQLSTE